MRPLLVEHPDRWVNLPAPHAVLLILELQRRGHVVVRAHMDPCGPRDYTIVLRDKATSQLTALVWDEESGLRHGRFVSGRQGERTRLENAVHLGGGLLPPACDVVDRMENGVSEPYRRYRAHTDLLDGFDDRLRALPWVAVPAHPLPATPPSRLAQVA
ncbi:hypothetical protein EDD29_0163 [Actinocorallia herbida]|uniref:Uncharacterized protein n=1 Tax=Actinocorallia herbida TaxID=58109 RepID=A0A3N1CMY6_9ACTN|nr:DUF6292 family protein [Actinocorallia herbida]ROO82681.1 hypothetical protein EDD29_0163 [Actinocorallia herbida]